MSGGNNYRKLAIQNAVKGRNAIMNAISIASAMSPMNFSIFSLMAQ